MDELILVDEQDSVVGYAEKLSVHRGGGRLHRAFSIFLFNAAGEMLLQLRSRRKYHFGGLWTNACCGHPRRGEVLVDAARQRLRAELGIDAELRERGSFIYHAVDPVSGLAEHEFDHVLSGTFDGTPRPHPDEVDDWKWMSVAQVLEDVALRASSYTPWFPLALAQLHGARRGDGQE